MEMYPFFRDSVSFRSSTKQNTVRHMATNHEVGSSNLSRHANQNRITKPLSARRRLFYWGSQNRFPIPSLSFLPEFWAHNK